VADAAVRAGPVPRSSLFAVPRGLRTWSRVVVVGVVDVVGDVVGDVSSDVSDANHGGSWVATS
jgi:hypothetical protein